MCLGALYRELYDTYIYQCVYIFILLMWWSWLSCLFLFPHSVQIRRCYSLASTIFKRLWQWFKCHAACIPPPFPPARPCASLMLVCRFISLCSWDGQGAAWAVRSLRLAVEEQGDERPGAVFTALLRHVSLVAAVLPCIRGVV